MVVFTARRQGLHDKIAGTLVVLRERHQISELPLDKSRVDVNE